jgi:hypothetical protein
VEWSSASRNELIFKYRENSGSAAPFHLKMIGVTGGSITSVPGTPDGVTITGYIGSFGMAPDGLTVGFSSDTGLPNAYEIRRVSLVAPTAVRLSSGTATSGRHPDFNRGFTFNPQGTAFAYAANYDLPTVMNQFEPYVVPMPNGPPVYLATFAPGGNVDDLIWSPDGTQLAFTGDWRTDDTFELALITSLTSNSTPTPLVVPVAGGDVFDAQWTP